MNIQNENNKKKPNAPFAALIALVLAVVCVFSVFLYKYEYEKFFNRETISLSGYNKEACTNLARKSDFLKEYVRYKNKDCFIRMKLSLETWKRLSKDSFSKALSDLPSKDNNFDYYLLDPDMKIVDSYADRPMTLTAEQLSLLAEDHTLEDCGRCYICEAASDGYHVIASDTELTSINDLNYEIAALVSHSVLYKNTGELLECSLDELTPFVNKVGVDELSGSVEKSVNGVSIRRIDAGGALLLAATREISIDGEAMLVSVFVRDGTARNKALFSVLSAACFMLLFAAACTFIITKLRKKWLFADNEIPDSLTGRFFRNRFTFRKQAYSLIAVSGILILGASCLLYSLHDILHINDEISTAYENLVALNDSYTQNQNVIYEQAISSGNSFLNDASKATAYSYDTEPNEWLREFADIMDVDEISMYDKNGVIEYSSEPYIGYSLSTDEAAPEFRLWELINGGKKRLIFFSQEENVAYLAQRRTDKVGIFLIKSSGRELADLIEKVEFADLLKYQDFANTDTLYSKRSDPETLYILRSGNNVLKITGHVLPMPDNGETYIGMKNFWGQDFLFINRGGADYVTMFAYPAEDLTRDALTFLLFSVIAFLMIAGAAGLLCHRLPSANEQFSADLETRYRDVLTEERSILHAVITFLAIVVVFILLLRGYVFGDGMMIYRFFEYWERSFNYVTLSFIVLSAGLTIGFILLIGMINSMLGKILSPKGATVCALLASIAKAVLVVAFVIDTLEKIGVNAMAITASLGLTGLALGIGSKDVISDLVAGIFIIFEGKIQLGDTIQTENFTGQVTSLGIRTATIRKDNNEMIINNTGLRNILNQSRGVPKVIVNVVVPFETDTDMVAKLVDDSSLRLMRACDDLLISPPSFKGISEFTEYGMELKIIADLADVAKIKPCSCLLRTELLKVLKENGILPAVLHPNISTGSRFHNTDLT